MINQHTPRLNKIIEYLIYALLFIIPFSKPGIEIFSALICVCFLIKKVLDPDFQFFKNPIFLFLALFFIFCALSVNNSGIFLEKSLRALFGKWFKNIFIFAVIYDSLKTYKNFHKAVAVLLASNLLMALLIIPSRLYEPSLSGLYAKLLNDIIPGYGNPNTFTATIIPILIIFCILTLSGQINKKIKIILAFCGILFGGALLFIASRSALISFIAAIIFTVFVLPHNKKNLLIFLTIAALLISIPLAKGRAISDAYRLSILSVTWDMIQSNPFLGTGIGTFISNFSTHAQALSVAIGKPYAHNCYLQIWAETGIFALVSFLGFLWLLLRQGIRAFKKSRDYVILGLTCGLFGYLVHASFDVHLYSLQIAALFWALAGLLSAASRIALDTE